MKATTPLRRLLSLLLCLVLCISLMPTAFADGITITSQPKSVTVTEGSSASFSVSATGTGLSYQWQFTKSGEWKNCTSTTAGYNTATLSPVGTAARNGYQYRCVITDANGNTVTSKAAKLTVKASSALAITTQPANATVTEGSSASFKVVATGTGLSYQWQFSKNGTDWKNCTSTTAGYNTATLKPVGTAARNGYQYRCIITDANGSTVTSNAAKLTVKASSALAITTQPANATVNEGSSASFKVVATGTGLSYQWQFSKNGTDWKNCTSTTAGYNTATLKPVGTAARNGYQYRCVITDANGSTATSNAAKLTVKTSSALAITTQPANATVNEGSSASFKVVATGAGLTYQWQYKGASATTWKNCTSTTSGYNTATLKPVGTAARNGYSYRCIVTDANGNTVTSNAAKLTVNSGLTITAQPMNVEADAWDNVSFSVKVSGGTAPYSYQWQFRYIYKATGEDTGWSFMEDALAVGTRTDTLSTVVYPDDFDDQAQFRCVITDANGKTVTSEPAKILKSCPVITTQPKDAVVAVGQSAVFIVEASGGKSPYDYRWQYKVKGTDEWKSAWSIGFGSSTTWFDVLASYENILGLYMFRCEVTDSAGHKVYSDEVSIIPPFFFSNQPQDADVNEGTTAFFQVSILSGEQPYTYSWQYKTTNGTSWKNCSSATAGYNTDLLRVEATAARNGYQYRCKVTDAAGTTITSDAAKLIVTPNIPITITVQPKNVDRPTSDFTSFSVETSGGVRPLSYKWQYGSVSNTGTVYWYDIYSYMTWASGIDTDRLSVNSITADRNYTYRCVITDANGDSVTSEAAGIIEKLPLRITTQPEDVEANVGDKVTFRLWAYAGTMPYSYEWQCRYIPVGSSDYNEWESIVGKSWASGADTSFLTITADNTDFTRKYQYRCVITDAAGNSVTSNAVSVIKLFVITQQPQNVTVDVGDSVSYTVCATGGTEPYSYDWQCRWIPSGSSDYNDWRSIASYQWASGAETATLSFTAGNADFERKYQYRCIITDAAGKSITSDTAEVYRKLYISQQPADVSSSVGNTISFSVGVSGGTAPYSYKWQYRTSNYNIWKDFSDSYPTADTATLSFRVEEDDLNNQYQYRCVITDKDGDTVVSEPANAFIKELYIDSQPESCYADEGDEAYFYVIPSGGVSPYTYQWQFRYLSNGSYCSWINISKTHSSWASGYDTDFLIVTVDTVDLNSASEYRCIITDSRGTSVTSSSARVYPLS